MKRWCVVRMALMALVLLGCGEKSAFEEKAEKNAKERAEENKAAHEKRQ